MILDYLKMNDVFILYMNEKIRIFNAETFEKIGVDYKCRR